MNITPQWDAYLARCLIGEAFTIVDGLSEHVSTHFSLNSTFSLLTSPKVLFKRKNFY